MKDLILVWKISKKIIVKVTTDWYNREKFIVEIAGEVEISQSSVAQILKKHNLTLEMKKIHFKFTIKYKN